MAREQRRLAAIVSADVAGYARLMGRDESGTLATLKALRRDVVDPPIAAHGGRIVKTTGDGLLLEFASAVDAVRCMIAVQRAMAARNADIPAGERVELRVGVNLGDIIVDGDDIFGDGVNVAARLEAAAPAGGIVVSAEVRTAVAGRLEATFDDLGELSLKNIERPVRAFRVDVPADGAGDRTEAADTTAARRSSTPAGRRFALPDKPSIAVLPFQNMSGDPEQEYVADGIAEDLITELSRSHALFVIARNSSFTYRGKAVDIRRVARELGVRYVLEGSVRRGGSRIRVTAQLIDAESGNHLWAERYDRQLDDIFAIQDEITQAAAIAIGPAVAEAEMQRAMRRAPGSLDAWDLYQRALWHMARTGPAENDQARSLFEQAIAHDPMFAAAHVGMARVFFRAGVQYLTMPVHEAAGLSARHARTAIELDPGDANAHASLALALLMQGERDEARTVAQQALAIHPSCASALLVMGRVLIYSGQTAQGREILARAERISPRDPDSRSLHLHVTMAYYLEGAYEACLRSARDLLAANPDFLLTYRWHAAALGQCGRIAEARAALDKALAMAPRFADFYVRNRPPWFRPEDYDHFLDGLRKAGWQG